MHVNGALFDVDVGAPDAVEELRTTVDALGMGHEEMQQTILRRPEPDFCA